MTVFGSLFVAVRPASAFPPTLNVTPGQYGHPGLPRYPYVYTPNETITFTVSSNTAGEIYDVVVYVSATNVALFSYNNVTIPAALAVTLTYQIPPALSDGQDYAVGVFDSLYIDRGYIGVRYQRQFFAVQAYELRVEVDRRGYIGGDTVIVTWSANNLRDGALASRGYGQLWAYNTNGVFFTFPSSGANVYVFPNGSASGIVQFRLPDPGDPRFDGIVFAWFNDTSSNPTRFQSAATTFGIERLSAIVAVAAPRNFAPGGIVTTTITTVATRNQAAPLATDPPEPGMNVHIHVFQVTPSGNVEVAQYGTGANTLVTDAHGKLTYVFQLLPTATVSSYEIHANVSSPSQLSQWENFDTFTVSVSAGLSQVLQFNKNEFQAGDTVSVTSIVTGAGGASVTYIFEVRDTTSATCSATFAAGTLLAKSTQGSNQYSYVIDPNFAGQICFRVTANAGTGTPVTSARAFNVVFGWLLVNANPQQYNPGDTVAVTWDLVSNRIQSPQYFYEVRDADGNLVASGSTNTTKSLSYPIPNPSSTRYTVTVTATQLGRTVAGSITLTQVTGFFIQVTFDRASYAPGDTMTVHYVISPRSTNSVPPSTYRITYGLLNGPSAGGSLRTISTAAASGDLTYTVPQGIDEGDQLFQISESNTATSAIEVVTVRTTSPLWFVTVGDIPILVIVMLIWLILMTLLIWRRGMLGGMGAPRPPVEAPPARPEPVHAPATSPMTVTCRSCGSPIEITTSKRPIEVMCPKCGNTEVVS